jgi:hypothetical protein
MPRKDYSVGRVSQRWFALSLACALALMACGSTEPGDDLLQFDGTITTAASGAPISGAEVSFADGTGLVPAIFESTTTDAQGRYNLSHHGCNKNPYIFAGASGYYANQKAVACKVGAITTVDISLTPSP